MSKLPTRTAALAGFALALLAGFMLFGITGFCVIFAAALFFVLAPYALLSKLSIEEDEKWFFSLFIGLGLFSTLVWFVGRVMPLKFALVSAIILLIIAYLLLGKRKPAAQE